ncbi:hypothetical protein ZWY2020_050104 [Hordeum vulgare]|nr:hypothetical protein ZWY2020_050104 [Hordeum vulgare]
MKPSIALKTCASMPSTCMTLVVSVPSFMAPKSSALKTVDLAASTHRCAAIVSPLTWNVTSVPSSYRRRSRKCFCMSEGGTLMNGEAAAVSYRMTTLSKRTPCRRGHPSC